MSAVSQKRKSRTPDQQTDEHHGIGCAHPHHRICRVVTRSDKYRHQNRDSAMKALKSKLYQIELAKLSAPMTEVRENATVIKAVLYLSIFKMQV
jgi:protein subunit release factor B